MARLLVRHRTYRRWHGPPGLRPPTRRYDERGGRGTFYTTGMEPSTYSPCMKRLSLSKSNAVVSPVVVFQPVPVPCTVATPVTPRKLKIVEGSTPGPRN